ncbi:c-type cytochrome [Reichenbachiella sp. MALMAid0571]|uniref:c-type cytochrome n=1 Tax=Reichenbachiella sp. MALMAid0571 TaxID=3143939 RepID=UPI0032DF02C0
MRKFILPNYWYVILLFALVGCSTPPSEETHSRPMHPWVFRSVLDYKPRMLTLALDAECFVAYDLNNCGLYRAWKGGVNWDGIVFNETKAMQPSAWGKDYILDKSSDVWVIEKSGRKETPNVRFLGYRLDKEQIFLKYQLSTKVDTVEIEERPEFVKDKKGNPGLERIFASSTTAQNISVILKTTGKTIKLDNAGRTVHQEFFEPIPEQIQTIIPDKSGHKGRYWIEKSDCFTCHDWTEKTVGPAFQQIAEKYSKEDEVVTQLAVKVQQGGSGVWGQAAMNPHPQLGIEDIEEMIDYILSLDKRPDKEKKAKSVNNKKENTPIQASPIKPGFGAPLEDVHPSFDLTTIQFPGIEFKVGGLAFLPDGRLVVATWTPHGSVYILEGLESGDSSKMKIKLIAQGLAEPLGLTVVEEDIFVLQKQELTQLIDHNGDEITDEYKAICNGFGVSADFHEFAFGLIYKDGHFYANLSLPLRLMTNEKPGPDRGKTIKIARDGSFEWINHGLREPNGIGVGIDDELFITDNQGQWLPANKFIHVRQGDFHGMRWGLPDSLADLKMVPPTVWLPEDEIANSPSEPSLMQDGPYVNQMIFGDVSHGGIKRVFLEKINGTYQGVAFRFTQGLKAGINRIRRGPDGAYYVGGVGMAGGWGWKNTKQGLQRLKYNNKVTFEMLAIKSTPEGFEIEFTEPLATNQGNQPSDYQIKQWWYLPTPAYGGPKMDLEQMAVKEVRISSDRTKVLLVIPNLKKEHVVKFDLNHNLQSASGQNLWSSEAWYTLNNIPQELNQIN